MRTYEYRRVVTFEDTNAVGNVYWVNHLRWQGRCRELFLRDHAPEVLAQMGKAFVLVTTKCFCEYFAELAPMDEVVVRMSLAEIVQNRITMGFDYYRDRDGEEELVARGEQQVAVMARDGDTAVPVPIPPPFRAALEPFVDPTRTVVVPG